MGKKINKENSPDLAKEYAQLVKEKLGANCRQVILFGSQARGEARGGSDYDIVVIVTNKSLTVREQVLDAGVEMMNRHGTLFAAIIYSNREWKKAQGFPLAFNIAQEGIAV